MDSSVIVGAKTPTVANLASKCFWNMLVAFPVIGVAVAGRSRLLDSFVYDSDGLSFSWRIALLSNERMPVALQPLARFSSISNPLKRA